MTARATGWLLVLHLHFIRSRARTQFICGFLLHFDALHREPGAIA